MLLDVGGYRDGVGLVQFQPLALAPREEWTEGLGFLTGEKTVYVSGAMQDADNFDAAFMRQVKDEVLVETANLTSPVEDTFCRSRRSTVPPIPHRPALRSKRTDREDRAAPVAVA